MNLTITTDKPPFDHATAAGVLSVAERFWTFPSDDTSMGALVNRGLRQAVAIVSNWHLSSVRNTVSDAVSAPVLQGLVLVAEDRGLAPYASILVSIPFVS
jgi:hypothetical protein